VQPANFTHFPRKFHQNESFRLSISVGHLSARPHEQAKPLRPYRCLRPVVALSFAFYTERDMRTHAKHQFKPSSNFAQFQLAPRAAWSQPALLLTTVAMVLALVGLSSCAGYTSAAKTGPGTTTSGVLSASTTTLAFGDVAVSNTSTQNLTVTNTGTAAVTIAQASISGAAFTVVGGMPSGTIAVGQSVSAQIQFAPTASGATSGAITIISDATDSPLDISLTGTGAQAGLSVSPATWSFGNTAVGHTTSESVKLTNTGTSNVVINLATVNGNAFGMSGLSLPRTLPAGQSMTFTAQFAPNAAGAAQGSISFTDNAPNSPQTLMLSGMGVAGTAALDASPSSISFGNVTVGSTGSSPVTLTNSGSSTITISQINISGAGVSIAGLATPSTLIAGQSTTFTARFSPASAAALVGSISVVSNASNSPLAIAVTGAGVAPQRQLTVDPISINFGSAAVGSSTSKTISLINPGNAPVTVTQFTASGSGFGVSGASLPLTINAGSSSSVSATFAPTSAGSTSGAISIISDAPGSPAVISLSGTGVQGQLSASPSVLTFGSVATGGSTSQNVTLTNGGSASVTISQATASGAGFSISGLTTPITLAAGQGTSFNAQFAPTSAGNANGTITISSNAPSSPTTISMTGVGTQPQISATPPSAAFGNVSTGTNNSQTITVTNAGSATLTISSVSVTGAGFSISGISAPVTILAGKNIIFNAVFAPTTNGAASGSISLLSNAPGSPLSISLSGTGVASSKVLGLSTSSLSFGNVNDGSSSSLSVAVTNNGNANVTISSVGVTGAGFSSSGVTAGEVLTPNQSATLTVQFAPTTTGAVSGSVAINSDATNSPSTISTSGTGITGTPHTVALAWTASTSNDINGYNVYRGTTSSGPYSTKVNPSLVGSVQFSDSSVTSGQTYYYVVTAVDSNNVESTFSNQATAIIP
jgi:hypothetical protein